MSEESERVGLLEHMTETIVNRIHATVWGDSGLTSAESRLIWLRVINKMLESVAIDFEIEVTKQHLGL